MKSLNFSNVQFLIKTILIVAMFSLGSTQQYVVGYVFQYKTSQRLNDNTVRIYQKSRTDIQVLLNNKTRQFYSKADYLNTVSDLNSQTLLKSQYVGTMKILKSPIPQNIWIDNKQIILKEVDLSLLQNSTDQIVRYSRLLKQKRQSFFIFNSDQQLNETLTKKVSSIFGTDQKGINLCKINMMRNKLQQNLVKIEQCYRNSTKKLVVGKYQTTFINMIAKNGLLGLLYLCVCFFIVFGTPFFSIWWQKKSIKVQSHI